MHRDMWRHENMGPGQRQRLLRAMSMLPRQCVAPRYDPGHFYDSYVKFFLYGDSRQPIAEHMRIFNKVGLAYGYMIDNAYIVDLEKKIEFLLSAVIAANPKQEYCGDYAYDQIGFPFLANLGRAVYGFELERPRTRLPDLSEFE